MSLRRTVIVASLGAMVAGLTAVVTSTVATAAVALPSGFVLQEVPSGMRGPSGGDPGDLLTDFGYLPDESILSAGKFGKVVWAPQTGASRTVATIPVNASGDLGLIGLAIAPDYATSHTIYTARAVSGTGAGSGANGFLRVSRWTVTIDTAGAPSGLTDEQTLVQMSADNNVHAMTGLVAAPDGTVWVSIGDNAPYLNPDPMSLRALDINDPHGKLLRMNADGSGVTSNPYYEAGNPRSVRSLVYASGFRSPFRFMLEAGTGRPILGDVGSYRYEEVNVVAPGNSYGWPCWEGTEPTPGYTDMPGCAGKTTASPLWFYPHVGGQAVTGGVIYRGTSYPQAYRGRYFWGDYVDKQVFTLAFNAQGQLTTPPESGGFGNDIGQPVKFATVPTGGDVVWADISTAKIRRLVYAPGNAAPTAVIKSTVDPATRTVSFDARDSSDPNGDALSYHWQFGDGTTADGDQVSHTYAASPESFTATLTATDGLGASGSATATVYPANHAPVIDVQEPNPDQTFAVGDVISASATANDQEDGALQVTWSTLIVHCNTASDCHNHPGAQQQGPQFQLTFAGHPGDSRLEITAFATDSKGATTSHTFVVKPKQRRVTIVSNIPANFVLGEEQTSSGLFTVGSNLAITAPAAAQDGVATFEKWGDDSTNRVRTLTLPDADQTLNVTYLTPIDRRYATDAALRGILGAPTNVEQGDATVRWREYTVGRLYWSPASNVHAVYGAILNLYLALGGHLKFGLPTTDETGGADGQGRFNQFTGGRAIYWHPNTGAHYIIGAIKGRWDTMGTERSYMKYPASDELGAPDGVGRYENFQFGSIYWSPASGAWDIFGAIKGRWDTLGNVTGYLGYPTTGETASTDGVGQYNHFQRGSVYWSPASGAWDINGAIRGRWFAIGAEKSWLKYPTTGESAAPDGLGRFNRFQNGAIYWHPQVGAWELGGAIYQKWASLGYERSWLGYPTSAEYDVSNGRRQNFANGYITWDRNTGATTATHW